MLVAGLVGAVAGMAPAAEPTLTAELDNPPWDAAGGDGQPRPQRATGDAGPTAVKGRFGRAAQLGKAATLEYDADNLFNRNSGTVTFWLRPSFDRNAPADLWEWRSDGGTTLKLFKGSAPRFYFLVEGGGGDNRTVTLTPDQAFDYGRWHHLAVGWDRGRGDDGQVMIWVDGKAGSSGGWPVDTLRDMQPVVRWVGGGAVDRVRVYPVMLNTAAVRKLADEPASPQAEPKPPGATDPPEPTGGGTLQEQDDPALLGGTKAAADQPDATLSGLLLGEPAVRRLEQLEARQDVWTVLPREDLQPAFTADAAQRFTLDLNAVGRRDIEVEEWSLNGEELPDSAWRVRSGTLEVAAADRVKLKPGFNEFELRYRHPQKPGKPGEVLRFSFPVNYQPDHGTVAYRGDGALLVDGRPTFAVGGFRSGQTDDGINALPTAREAGLSFVHDYANDRVPDLKRLGLDAMIERTRAYLRAAEREGLGVVLALPRQAVVQFDEPVLARWVSELSGERGLWFWYLYDEPDPKIVPPLAASRSYQLVTRLDPNHPVVVVCNRESSTAIYHGFADAVWPDKYPVTATGREMISLSPLYADLRGTRQAVGPDQPIAPVLQLHDNRGIPWLRKDNPDLARPSDHDHRPTADEVRAMAHLSLAAGVRGLSFYWAPESWYSMKSNAPGLWRSFGGVVRELRELEAVVLADSPAERTEFSFDPQRKVAAWSRVLEGELWLGLVNPDVERDVEVALSQEGWSVHAAHAGSRLDSDGRATLGPAGVLVLRHGGGDD